MKFVSQVILSPTKLIEIVILGLVLIKAEFPVATESLGPVTVYRTFRPKPVCVADQECNRGPFLQ